MKAKYSDFFQTILDSVADGIFTVDKNRRITSFNRAAQRITGFAREEAIGKPCYEVFHASICQNACALEEALKTGNEVIDRPLNIINKEGKAVPISVSASVLSDGKGNVRGGVETFRDLSAIEELKKEIQKRYTFEDIVSKNREIQKIFNMLPDVAESDSTVLIEGPSGSGKELFARAIHNLSARKEKPYVVVNCGALPDNLIESELFGYVKGAFTDAHRDKQGRFALAEGGTIFLDEIGDISPLFQVKLLRILQEKEYEPLGSTKTMKADVRIMAATNRNLAEQVRSGKFRQDLYYRFNIVRIELPPLARRREDIPLLIEHFISVFNLKRNKKITGVSDNVMDFLMRYSFPGNIRELENIIEHAFVLCHESVIEIKHLPSEIIEAFTGMRPLPKDDVSPLNVAEKTAIEETLKKHSGMRAAAARDLGISTVTLWRKMKKFQIEFSSELIPRGLPRGKRANDKR
ncbi:MAG: sigma 54-interacting transcriptional regulator [Deltaproteobacteria bacterium]|nr:sigma 54-interacting transcriptional regulator [Deltaproteobacteria bacterium]